MAPARRDGPPIRRRRAGAALLWTAAILLGCWIPPSFLPEGERVGRIPHADKVAHAGMFFAYGVLSGWAANTRARSLWAAAIGMALAAGSELGQALPFVGRDANVWDAMADVAGLAAGLAFVAAYRRARARLRGSRFAR